MIRLLQLQVFGGEKYRELAYGQQRKSVELAPKRGTIYDRNGTALATSVSTNTCYLFPEEVSEVESTKQKLMTLLDLDRLSVDEAFDKKGVVRLKSDLSNGEADSLRNSKLNGLSIATENRRHYPHPTIASHVIGFTNTENVGQYGIEASMNDVLMGKSGLTLFNTDPGGQVIPLEEPTVYEATQGSDIVLTIDERIQTLVHQLGEATYEKYRPKNLSVIVTNPNTGEVLSMANFPGYDISHPREPRSEMERAAWRKLSNEELTDKYFEAWRNPAVSNVYEPGSVYKALTTAAAIDEGTATKDSHYNCEGTITDIPGVIIRCYRWYDPHGEQTLKEALGNSCNPAFVQIARDLGPERMFKYVKAFGFGQATGIELPAEEKGITVNAVREIGPANLATMSYGHGIAVTPIQMITAVNSVVNGGRLMKPYLVAQIKDDKGQELNKTSPLIKSQVLSQQTSQKMLEFLEYNVAEATSNGAKIKGYRVGGKSGTSIKFVDGAYTEEKTYASYYGVYPADKPEYSILVIADEPNGATGGNEVAGTLVEQIFQGLISQRKDAPITGDESEEVRVPNILGLELSQAVETLKSLDLKYNMCDVRTSAKSRVIKQYPEPGNALNRYGTVDLATEIIEIELVEMPDLKGMTKEEVEVAVESLSVTLEVNGEGVVSSQLPEAGEQIETGSVVKVLLEDKNTDPAEEETT